MSENTKQEEFEFFWESDSPFSNWHKSDFLLNGIKFNCAEQAMMYGKAMCFGDNETAQEILKTKKPRDQKALGRKVKNFDSKIWDEKGKKVVYEACKAKFTQNPHMHEALMKTSGKTLVEASPYDTIWGIGLFASDIRAKSRDTWRGKNYLGELLTTLREELIEVKNRTNIDPSISQSNG
ncbi:MAG: NADAR family protein [Crocinitomicaceae bacterium]|nr:MAG: NADAR family protein [Crocinitomicaceae bacterium]